MINWLRHLLFVVTEDTERFGILSDSRNADLATLYAAIAIIVVAAIIVGTIHP